MTQTPGTAWRRLVPQAWRISWPTAAACLLASATLFHTLCFAAGDAEAPALLPPVEQGETEQCKAAIQQMAAALFRHLGDPDPGLGDLADGLVVSSFVDLKKLTRTSSFGRYLAEQLMTEFQQRGYRVVDIRKSNAIQIQETRGEYGLSREPGEIKANVAARAMITGTYAVTADSVLVNAKVLDNRSAALLTSATMIFPRTKMVNQMLADSATAHPPSRQQQELTTMKRLDL